MGLVKVLVSGAVVLARVELILRNMELIFFIAVVRNLLCAAGYQEKSEALPLCCGERLFRSAPWFCDVGSVQLIDLFWIRMGLGAVFLNSRCSC